MKRSRRLLLLLGATQLACNHTVSQLQAPCSLDKYEILERLESIVQEQGLEITMSSPNLGVLEAMNPPHNELRGEFTDVWQFNVYNDTIFAIAKTQIRSFGGRPLDYLYRNDNNMSSSSDWYWNVRNGIDTICEGTTVVFRDME